MHIVGGYGEGRVDRAYHHVYDPGDDRWFNAAPLPRGANHVAVVADAGRVYALGGFIEQNRNPDPNAFFYDVAADKWTTIAPLPRSRGAAAAVALDGKIHLIGGAGAPTNERASVGWHEVYDPQADKWEIRKALPAARDHVGAVAYNGVIHIIGGRFNTFEYNTDLHHVYLPALDTWKERAPLPTPRSGHGLVVYRDRFFAMGGEYGVQDRGQISQGAVFGQMESYDPATNSWQAHAPMTTPRHAVGATTIGDADLRCGRRGRDRRLSPVVRARSFYAGWLIGLAAASHHVTLAPGVGETLQQFAHVASGELREAVADRPILFRGLENVHEHVLRPDAGVFAEQLRGPPEQRFLLFRGAGVEHGDLDVHDIFAPADAIAGRAVAEVRSVMLRDGHELVVFGHIQALRASRGKDCRRSPAGRLPAFRRAVRCE